MRTRTRTLAWLALAIALAACEHGGPEIRTADDLRRFAADFQHALEQEGLKPACTVASLEDVEDYMKELPEGVKQAHIPIVGAYLGQCMIDNYGGEWVEDQPGVWAVKFSDGNMAFPLVSVQRFVADPQQGNSFAAVYGHLPVALGLEEKTSE